MRPARIRRGLGSLLFLGILGSLSLPVSSQEKGRWPAPPEQWQLELEKPGSARPVLVAPDSDAPQAKTGGAPWQVQRGAQITVVGANSPSGLEALEDSAQFGGYGPPAALFFHVIDGERVGYLHAPDAALIKNGIRLDDQDRREAILELIAATRTWQAEIYDEADFAILSLFHTGPDSDGGVGAELTFRLLDGSRPDAELITLTVTPLDAEGKVVFDSVSGLSAKELRAPGPFEARPFATVDLDSKVSWGPAWHNDSIACLRLDRVRIEFSNRRIKRIEGRLLERVLLPGALPPCHRSDDR